MKGKVVRGAVLAIAVAALAPGAANAAQITVTGDARSPVALNPAAPMPLRNTDITVTINKDVGDGNITVVTRDPTGAVAVPRTARTAGPSTASTTTPSTAATAPTPSS